MRGFFSRINIKRWCTRRAKAGGGCTGKAGGQASDNCINHIKHLSNIFQALHQEVVHPGEPEQEVGVSGGQRDRVHVIVHTTFIIIRDFLRLCIKRWCTQESWSRRWEYLESKGTGFR